ncbi:MAG: nucleoside 2-deoxyribosyltransferase [Propionibacteriaceae bacterium]|nr:nucleoside 2-deoxyribosyltransferase [Propionibacteriaceae bacterium]
MTALGVTGHQNIPLAAREYVVAGIRDCVGAQPAPLIGYSSLAAGADQLFAREVLAAGGQLIAIIPSQGYEGAFAEDGLRSYQDLLASCTETVTLDFTEPSEEAFMAAGEEVMRRSDVVIAVWDGLPAAGLGGTADAVEYARGLGKTVVVVWPEGVRR